MTRINIIPPQILTDQHLIGEYNEIRRPVSLAINRHNKYGRNGFKNIPLSYTLGGGHVTFFFDKLEYLHKRFLLICEEMKIRGFTPQTGFDTTRIFDVGANYLYNDWVPNEHDVAIIKNRLKEKILMQNHRYYGKPINREEYLKFVLQCI